MDTPENESKFVVCQCQHCGGHIEFDASHEGESVSCPHCHKETVISVHEPTKKVSAPKNANPPAIKPSSNQKELFSIKVTSRALAVFFAFTTFGLASILVWEHLTNRSQPVSEKQAPSPTQPVPADKISGSEIITVEWGGNVNKFRLDEVTFENLGFGIRVCLKSNGEFVGMVSGGDTGKVKAYLHGN
ncbi:MAG TPA: hypothetical protein VIK53_17065 [Verrucomicrobiae bacterium]